MTKTDKRNDICFDKKHKRYIYKIQIKTGEWCSIENVCVLRQLYRILR